MTPLPFGTGRLRQPDARSCGPSCLVVARMLRDPAYADAHLPDFAAEVLATHEAVVGWWPRALGTPPWALAAHLVGGPHTWRRAGAASYDLILTTLASGSPVALYVGDRWLPRHVVLPLELRDGVLCVYDPARGTLVVLTRDDLTRQRLPFGRWRRAWFVVSPRAPRRARRSPA